MNRMQGGLEWNMAVNYYEQIHYLMKVFDNAMISNNLDLAFKTLIQLHAKVCHNFKKERNELFQKNFNETKQLIHASINYREGLHNARKRIENLTKAGEMLIEINKELYSDMDSKGMIVPRSVVKGLKSLQKRYGLKNDEIRNKDNG